MYYAELREGQLLYSFEDYGACFFIVDKGRLEITTDDRSHRKTLRPLDGISSKM
jgi:hypothetical protein